MKLGVSHQRPGMLAGDHLRYLKQMGVQAMEARILSERSSLSDIVEIRQRVEEAGFELFEVMLSDRYNCREIAIGGPDRDRDIDFFLSFLENLGRAGVDKTTYAWHFGDVYKTGKTETRGCQTRLFDLAEVASQPPLYQREYGAEEMWDNYAYFVERVLPVAEANGVRLQLHPNDPPVDRCGVARIFSSTAAYRRAMEISGHSPYSGILFCVGCWAEMYGPNGEGEDIVAAIEELGSQGHIIQVHFRNIDRPLPRFAEVFPDDGYVQMPNVMHALRRVGFTGMVVPDHVPRCVESGAGSRAGEAFIFGYIRALIQATALP